MSRAAPSHRRGSVYVALLGVTTIVTIIGVSALMAVRIQRRAAEAGNDAAEARFYAQSAADLALFWIQNDPLWRQHCSNDTWLPDLALDLGTLTWKLVDELDGDLANDTAHPARLYARGTIGATVRIHSVLLEQEQVDPSANLLTNADMESGTTGWTGLGYCDLESKTDGPHGGAAYLRVKNRDYVWAGPNQYITTKITSGTAYNAQAWVKTKDFAEPFRLTIYTRSTDSGNDWVYVITPPVGTEWTFISATLTPTWTGTLSRSTFYVETTASTQEFRIDDALLCESDGSGPGGTLTMVPVAGTWRRETLP